MSACRYTLVGSRGEGRSRREWLRFQETEEAEAVALPAEREQLERIAEQINQGVATGLQAIRAGQDGDVFATVNAGFAEAKQIWDQMLSRGAK